MPSSVTPTWGQRHESIKLLPVQLPGDHLRAGSELTSARRLRCGRGIADPGRVNDGCRDTCRVAQAASPGLHRAERDDATAQPGQRALGGPRQFRRRPRSGPDPAGRSPAGTTARSRRPTCRSRWHWRRSAPGSASRRWPRTRRRRRSPDRDSWSDGSPAASSSAEISAQIRIVARDRVGRRTGRHPWRTNAFAPGLEDQDRASPPPDQPVRGPSQVPFCRHSATTRSLSDQIRESIRPASVSRSPFT